MKISLIWVLGALVLFAGCKTPRESPHQRGEISYQFVDDEIIVINAKTPFDKKPEARDAYIFWFRRGFFDAIYGRINIISWEKSLKGDAGAAGYAHGLSDGALHKANP